MNLNINLNVKLDCIFEYETEFECGCLGFKTGNGPHRFVKYDLGC